MKLGSTVWGERNPRLAAQVLLRPRAMTRSLIAPLSAQAHPSSPLWSGALVFHAACMSGVNWGGLHVFPGRLILDFRTRRLQANLELLCGQVLLRHTGIELPTSAFVVFSCSSQLGNSV